MKVIKFLIILLSLSLPIQSYACWDDDMDDDYDFSDDDYDYDDWWNDDWWNDDYDNWNDDDYAWKIDLPEVDVNGNANNDYAWEIDLPEVEITPDSSSDTDNDWGLDEDNNEFEDENNENWNEDEDEDDDVGGWGNSDQKQDQDSSDKWKNEKWHVPSSNEILLNWNKWEYLPEHWTPQNSSMNCVSTALEYIANYLENKNPLTDYSMYRTTFECLYSDHFNRDLFDYGVAPSHLESFYKLCGFDVEKITPNEISNCILEHNPILGTIESESNYYHDVFIIGYFSDTNLLQTINPTTGTFQAFDKEKFANNLFYKVNSFK